MLTFNLKKEWFDKIKSGEKTHEYREVKYSWTTRLVKEFYGPANAKQHRVSIEHFLTMLRAGFVHSSGNHNICFMNGMVPEEEKPRLYAKYKSVKIVNGKETDLDIDKEVYDIEFEVIK